MIGIVILYLVSTQLGLGMLISLLSVSQKVLGERFFRLNGTISLSLLVIGQSVYHFYGISATEAEQSHRLGSWNGLIEASFPWVWSAACVLLLFILSLPYRQYRLSRLLLITASLAGGVALGRVALGLGSPAIPESVGGLIFTLDFLLSSLALGSVVICMILGHWYLVEPGMSVRHLKTMTALFIGVVSARVLLGSVTSVFIWNDFAASGEGILSNAGLVNLLFFGQRILFGLVLPLALSWMIWQTVKIRSTQSATGILYVAVVFVLFGELLSRYILVATGYPL